jgi:hypothetical protein
MRLTYGTIGGYSPADAEEFRFYTTTDGILQKEDPTNPEFVVPAKLKELILAKDFGPYTNKKVLELNQLATSYLGKTAEFVEGDDIVVGSLDAKFIGYGNDKLLHTIYPACINKGKVNLEAVNKIEADIVKFNTKIDAPTIMVSIDDMAYNVYMDLQHYEHTKELSVDVETAQANLYKLHNIPENERLSDWCKSNRHLEGVNKRAKAWQAYLTHTNLVFDVRRPYARTVHKSQGSEFNTVFISQKDIKKSIRPGYYLQYARLMYVALSRAIHKVVIID